MRRHIFTRAGLPNAGRVLEIGCGTGAVLAALPVAPNTRLFGIDIDPQALAIAKTHAAHSHLSVANAHILPFGDGTFDIAFFHYVLLWLADPLAALGEARRVTRPGGAVIAFAEPDYTQRQDEPKVMAELGRLQTEALRQQGADIAIGGRLAGLFTAAGLAIKEAGQLQPPADPQPIDALELEVLHSDLEGLPASRSPGFSRIFAELGSIDPVLIKSHVPTFFCWAFAP